MKRWMIAAPLALPLVALVGWTVDASHAAFWTSGMAWSLLSAGLSLPSVVTAWGVADPSPKTSESSGSTSTPTSTPTASRRSVAQSSRSSGAGVGHRRWARWACMTMCVFSFLALMGAFVALVAWPEQSSTWSWTIMVSMLSLLVWGPALALVGTGDRPEPVDFIPHDYFERQAQTARPQTEMPASEATPAEPSDATASRRLWPGAGAPAASPDRSMSSPDASPADGHSDTSRADTERVDLDTIWAAASARISGDPPPRAARGGVADEATRREPNGASTGTPNGTSNGAASTRERSRLWPPVDDASDAEADAGAGDAWEPGDWPDFRYDAIAEEGG